MLDLFIFWASLFIHVEMDIHFVSDKVQRVGHLVYTNS